MRRVGRASAALFVLACCLFAISAEPPKPQPSLKELLPRLAPREPAEALKTFRVADGFSLHLVAHEPAVTSPVAAAYDEDGRLYVVEMRDYPEPHKPGEKPLGRVRRVLDADGDGVYESAAVLADGLPWPTGIACWDGGVFVTAAPDVWYLKDTTGDGIADVKKKVFTGFVVNNVQALVNGLQWGVDNKIYGVTAGNGGAVRRADRPDAKPVVVNGRDFRFDPRTLEFEAIEGTAQFGQSFDDWYNRFLCANRLVGGHAVFPASALGRNPHLAATRLVHDCAAEGSSETLPMFQVSDPEPWRVLRVQRYKEQGQKLPQSEMVAAGIFTSGTGIGIYRGAAYPEKYRGNLFVGNVAGNMVHRRTLTPAGATFTATRADEGKEFLASTDNWFRPTNTLNAPDGCQHVLDMYREVVEHPWSLPDDIKNELHMDSGRDRGRIYRLAPPGFKTPPPPKLSTATTAELVATLENPNSWWREAGQRLLIQKGDAAAVEPLRTLTRESKSPLARLHALWTLEGLKALNEDDVREALKSPTPQLRVHALKLAEPRLAKSEALQKAVVDLHADAGPQVRFRVAILLGNLDGEDATTALTAIARRDANDPWTRLAVLSSSASRAATLFGALDESSLPLSSQLVTIIGSRNKADEVRGVLRRFAARDSTWSRAAERQLVRSLADGLMRNGKTLSGLALPADDPARLVIARTFADAEKLAFDPKASPEDRETALNLLAHAEFATARKAFETALDPRQPQTLQIVAVRAMRTADSADVPPMLLKRWATLTPIVRGEAITTLFARPAWTAALLTAVEAGTVPRSHLDSSRQAILKAHRDPKIKDRAAKLFTGSTSAMRDEVLKKYQSAAEKPGSPEKGLTVFRRECASCHLAGNVGQIVGPAVPTFRDKTPQELLAAVLDPNREVDPRYLNYTVTLADGRLTTGVIAGESPTAITLRRAEGAIETVLRSQIDEVKSTALSLMPEELEKKITPDEMADLIAFLKDGR